MSNLLLSYHIRAAQQFRMPGDCWVQKKMQVIDLHPLQSK